MSKVSGSGAIWGLMIGSVALAFSTMLATRVLWGKLDPSRPTKKGFEIFKGVRDIDAKARSRLEDLGVRFSDATKSLEPGLDLQNPTDADFRFLEDVLASNDDGARVSAAKVLRDMGLGRGVEPLIASIRGIDKIDEFFLECALTIVNRLPLDQRIAALVPTWEAHGETLPESPRDALRLKLRDVGALDPEWLTTTLATHSDPVFRRFAIRELALQKDPPKGALAAALADPDDEVRKRATAALTPH